MYIYIYIYIIITIIIYPKYTILYLINTYKCPGARAARGGSGRSTYYMTLSTELQKASRNLTTYKNTKKVSRNLNKYTNQSS